MTPNSATSLAGGAPGCIDAVSTSTSVGVAGVTTVSLKRRAVRAPGWSLAAALLGFFMVTLDAVIVNVALPGIQRQLAGGMGGLQWVVDGYLLAFAALMLTGGTLGDLFGRKRVMLGGLAVFIGGAVVCALASG